MVDILRAAHVRDGRVTVARIRCSVRCRVHAEADGARRSRTVRTTIDRTRLVTVPWKPSDGRRLGIVLFVGDGPRLRGTTHIVP